MRVINGVAVIGGEQETFYGGILEVKGDSFQKITGYSMCFSVSDESESWSILRNEMQCDTDAFALQDQKIGQISGQILNTNMEESAFSDGLSFELTVMDQDGTPQTFMLPLEVTQIK